MRSPCLKCDRLGEDKNTCVETCEAIKMFQASHKYEHSGHFIDAVTVTTLMSARTYGGFATESY